MVGGVEAVVEQQPIGDFSGEVAGVIEVRVMVAILMLEEIDPDEGELRRDPWENEKQGGGTEIDEEECDESGIKYRAFEDGLAEEAGSFRFPCGEIGWFFPIHSGDGCEGEREEIEDVPAEANETGADEIQIAFRVLMMSLVVSGDDTSRWLADGES